MDMAAVISAHANMPYILRRSSAVHFESMACRERESSSSKAEGDEILPPSQKKKVILEILGQLNKKVK